MTLLVAEAARSTCKIFLQPLLGILLALYAFGWLAEVVWNRDGLSCDVPILLFVHQYATPARDAAMVWLTDDLIEHLDVVLTGLKDPFIESRYTGFLAVSSVTVLELAMKSIFMDFAASKHKVLANFCGEHFDQINGRIRLAHIQGNYLKRFGKKYQDRFERSLEKLERQELKTSGVSIKSSYGNLITWRHGFAHQGDVPANASYNEVKRAYGCGKQVMHCLAGCMRR